VPNFIEIGRTVWEISHFNDFQNGRRPPSRIFNIQDGGRRILTVVISGESRYRGVQISGRGHRRGWSVAPGGRRSSSITSFCRHFHCGRGAVLTIVVLRRRCYDH